MWCMSLPKIHILSHQFQATPLLGCSFSSHILHFIGFCLKLSRVRHPSMVYATQSRSFDLNLISIYYFCIILFYSISFYFSKLNKSSSFYVINLKIFFSQAFHSIYLSIEFLRCMFNRHCNLTTQCLISYFVISLCLYYKEQLWMPQKFNSGCFPFKGVFFLIYHTLGP